ncbi:MAG: exodeoxyribonuclease III [Bacteroidia bacterium]|nr:exodeoxyribonuclease III [Bacteroidia bacterium]
MKTLISYNVNGIRSAMSKGFLNWLATAQPDVLCLQETKAQPDQLTPDILNPPGYYTYWHSAQKKGYSGVAILCKEEPRQLAYGCGIEKYDLEGRVLRADFDGYSVMSVYLPSGSSGEDRQGVKEEFLADFLPYLQQLKTEIPNLVVCGDFNICHEAIDIHDPVGNKKSSGFLPHERAWMSELIAAGFTDVYRKLNPSVKKYSWWSFRFQARLKNKGWRIDYHMVTDALAAKCTSADILNDVEHSDHCPVMMTLDV